ncbi:MAG: Tol-Pal system beta propeller repeat protein TolB [Geobacter sp.]|nr:Tol-Pal system beta propeller repeat protein TolB [Geobacter sp.]
MTRWFMPVFILLMAATAGSAQEGYLEVTAAGKRQLVLAVAPATSLKGSAFQDVNEAVEDVFRFDMTLTGLFTVMERAAAERLAASTATPAAPFASWVAGGADLLLKSSYSLEGDRLTMEFRLYEVGRGRLLAANRYSGSHKDMRRLVHGFSDEVMRYFTGEKGPFTCKIAYVSAAGKAKELHLMDYDGHNVLRLTRNGSINLYPDFASNGRELVYTSYKKGNPDLYRRELSSGAELRMSTRGTNITATWAPDGNRIALSQSLEGNAEIHLVSKEGKPLARLTTNPAIDISPSWSPDSSRIAFVSDRLGKPQVFVMSADGSQQRRLTTHGDYNVSPRWSPKGDRIVYARQMPGGFQLFAINPDGTNDTQLTTDGSNEHPRWSPDGRFIAFSSKEGGKSVIYVMRADGTGKVRVSRGAGSDSHPAWSPRW